MAIASSVYGVMLGQLHEMKALQTEFLPNGRIVICKGKYVTRLDYYARKKSRKIAEIEIGMTPKKYGYFQLRLYPSQFKGAEFAKLKDHIDMFFEQGFYEGIYANSSVTYIELATDTVSHEAQHLIPFSRRTNHSLVYVDKVGAKGATYIGAVTSRIRFCIYDKAKQLLETNQVVKHVHAMRTRIEARIRKTGLKPYELVTHLKNPFLALRIADANIARDKSKTSAWHQFLDECELVGSAMALAKCSKKVRKEYMEALKASKVNWWKATYAWEGLSAAIAVIAP